MINLRIIKVLKENYCQYLFLLLSFSLPLWQKLSTILLLCLTVASLFKLKEIRFNKQFLGVIFLYFVYVLFELIHPPVESSMFEMKASLIVLPIIFMTNNFIEETTVRKSYRFFVFGILTACFFCYIKALISSLSFFNGLQFNPKLAITGSSGFLESSIYGGNYFFGNHFSIFHQSVYFSIFLNIAVIILLFTDVFKMKSKYVLVLFIGLALFQVSNRVNIFVYILLLISGLVFIIKNKKTKLIMIVFSSFIGCVILISNPRVKTFLNKIHSFEFVINRESEDSFGTRILVWNASLDLIKDNLYSGVGYSKAYESLKKVYKKKRYVIPYRNRLNSHNQYFQILVECGIIGLLTLLIVLGILLQYRKSYQLLKVFFLTIIVVNFLFESVFNRYSGLVCFMFFYSSLLYINKKRKKA